MCYCRALFTTKGLPGLVGVGEHDQTGKRKGAEEDMEVSARVPRWQALEGSGILGEKRPDWDMSAQAPDFRALVC